MKIEWPPIGFPVWEVFRRLGRPTSMNGVESITNQEILAYQTVARIRLTDWELDVIAMFDGIAVEVLNKK